MYANLFTIWSTSNILLDIVLFIDHSLGVESRTKPLLFYTVGNLKYVISSPICLQCLSYTSFVIKISEITESDSKMIKHFFTKFCILIVALVKIPLENIVFMQNKAICTISVSSNLSDCRKYSQFSFSIVDNRIYLFYLNTDLRTLSLPVKSNTY